MSNILLARISVDISCFTPWQRVTYVIIGPIKPTSEKGNHFILNCQDYFSKWIVVKPTRSTASDVVEIYSDLLMEY